MLDWEREMSPHGWPSAFDHTHSDIGGGRLADVAELQL